MGGFGENSLEGLSVDHQVEVYTLTGKARLSVPIKTSPGRESFGPDIALEYASGEGNSPFGVGWTLSGIPSIRIDLRRTLPAYCSDKDRYVFGGGQELVPCLRKQGDQWLPVLDNQGNYRVQRFRSRIERSFERFEKWEDRTTHRVHWVTYARNGVVSVFGKSDDDLTRIADPADPVQRTFEWLLEAQYHPKGNAIAYVYEDEKGADIDTTASFEARRMQAGTTFAQRYLKRILYGNSKPLSLLQPSDPANEWHFEVVFDYGEHHPGSQATPVDTLERPRRLDPFSAYRPGFELRTYRLCRRILMFHRFAEFGAPFCLVGATELTHHRDPAGSILKEITYHGYRKDPVTGSIDSRSVPPLKLSYNPAGSASSFEEPVLIENTPLGIDDTVYQWIDLKNEGLPGILFVQNDGWRFKENLGDGRFGPQEAVNQIPAAVSAAFQLQDFDGDGNLNLVGFEGREAGYYRHDRDGRRWEGFRAFRNLPRVDFANARVQWVDLNGDGHADLMVEHQDRLVWYPSEGADGFSAPLEIAKPDVRAGGAPTLTRDGRLHTFFADMTGDGLLDMVRVDNGRLQYWPNLGHAVFGPSVEMKAAPFIDGVDQFDTQRLHFVDLDGSGTADLLYIGRGELRFWINQSGNRLGPENRLIGLPYIDQLSSARVFDFLGDGTQCLVWSTPLPTREGQAIQYLRLTDLPPPRLLLSVSNSMGRETRLSYRSSAREYLRDKSGDRPWRTLLPQHSIVVTQIEGIDHIGGGRIVSRFEYRDGYFDDEEHRFVAFGCVDTFDSDQLQASGSTPPEQVSPPSMIRNWYHTADWEGFADRAGDFYARDPLAAALPTPGLENLAEMTTQEQLDAYRALAGMQWRQEIYIIRSDGIRTPHPIRINEYAYRVRCEQPAQGEQAAAFSFIQSETLDYEYEEDPSDPRISHSLIFDCDAYGNALLRASCSYPRRSVGPEVRFEQQVLHAEIFEEDYVNINTAARYEAGIAIEERRWTLSGLPPPGAAVFDRESLRTHIQAALADPVAFHESAAGGMPQARLIERHRNLFYDDARLSAAAVGQIGAVTLLHHVQRAMLPEAAVDPLYGGRVTGQMLSGEGNYHREDGFWWADDLIYRYDDAAGFYRLREETAPGGGRQIYGLDTHSLMITAIEDGFGNRVEFTPDYQLLAASAAKDANDNIAEARYDPLGIAFVSGSRGQQLGSDGGVHPVGTEDINTYVPQPVASAADVLADPGALLQGSGRFFFYDLAAFERGDGPPLSIYLEREQHPHDGEGGGPASDRIRLAIDYIDGFGRSIQSKIRIDPGPAVKRSPTGEIVVDGDGNPIMAHSDERWLTDGYSVYNNKGWLVRRYEPLFTTRPDFESDASLRTYGTATRTHYDPLGRIVREDIPNGTFTTNTYGAWQIHQSDANDNVVGSLYEARRYPLPASDPERIALTKAQAHARTPIIADADPLGRAFRVREVDPKGNGRMTTTIYGDLDLPYQVIDPRGLTAFTYRYDMLGNTLFEHSIDAGERFTLRNAQGQTIHVWDSRDLHTEYRYDTNDRHTETRVDGALGLDNIVERIVYGDDPAVDQPKLRNARGRVVKCFDDAGTLTFDRYHLAGHALDIRRIFRTAHDTTVDWADTNAVGLSGEAHRTRNRMDGFGRIMSQSLPDGTTREYEYAAMGHVAAVRVSTADGQRTRQVIASGIETNARGQRTRLRSGNGIETSYEYDADTFRLERLHVFRANGATRDYLDVAYTYDPVGNITHWIDWVQEPGAPAPILQGLAISAACEFTYDAFYQLTTATGRVHQALLQNDYRSGLAAANAIKGTRHLSLNNGAAVERYTRTYTYDPSGNIEKIRHQGATHTWTTEMWTSPTSNRSLPKKELNGIDIANPESHFDPNGNTVALPHLRAMDWNYANRLSRAVIIDRSAAGGPDDAEYYVYGADGLRVRRITERLVAGQLEVTETAYFDGCELRRVRRNGNLRLERYTSHITDGSARLATMHQWTVDQAALETDDTTAKKIHYLAGNHLGSVALELGEAGEVISYEEYFPFGGTSFIAGDSERDVKLKEYRYSSKPLDDSTGFYCYEYRYYAPFIGNWISPDPLGSEDGLNLYRFVRNNPIRFIDADGLETSDVPLNQQLTLNVPEGTGLQRNPDEATGRHLNSLRVTSQTSGLKGLTAKYQGGVYLVPGEFVWHQSGEWIYKVTGELEPLALAGEEAAETQTSGEITTETPPPGDEPQTSRDADIIDPEGEGKDRSGSVHPADGSSGTGKIQSGQTGESGSNGNTAAGGTAAAGRKPPAKSAGAGGGTDPGGAEVAKPGKSEHPSAGEGEGGKGKGVSGSQGGGARPNQSSGSARHGARDVPPVPPGVRTGPDGVPYSPDMQIQEVKLEAGTPGIDPNQAPPGARPNDGRSQPGTENGNDVRPQGIEGDTAGPGQDSQRGDGDGRGAAGTESTLDTLARWAGYLNLSFDEPEDGGKAGGIPGGFGLFDLRGGVWQVLYIVATVVSTVLMVQAIVKSVSLAALRQGWTRLVSAIRSPASALRSVWTAARGFWDETVRAASRLKGWVQRGRWREFFRLGRWAGPGSNLRILFRDMRRWASIQRWRDHSSFWFKPRWFGKGPHYNWEHIIPQSLGANSARLRGFLNSYMNSFLRLPSNFNSALGNRLIPKLQFYSGSIVAVFRSWQFGQWIGGKAAEEIYTAPDARGAAGR